MISSAAGTIQVTTNLSTATFTISGPANYSGSETAWTTANAPAGAYTITFGAVSGYTAPAAQTQTLAVGGTISFTGTYTTATTTNPFQNCTFDIYGTLNISGQAVPVEIQTLALSDETTLGTIANTGGDVILIDMLFDQQQSVSGDTLTCLNL